MCNFGVDSLAGFIWVVHPDKLVVCCSLRDCLCQYAINSHRALISDFVAFLGKWKSWSGVGFRVWGYGYGLLCAFLDDDPSLVAA